MSRLLTRLLNRSTRTLAGPTPPQEVQHDTDELRLFTDAFGDSSKARARALRLLTPALLHVTAVTYDRVPEYRSFHLAAQHAQGWAIDVKYLFRERDWCVNENLHRDLNGVRWFVPDAAASAVSIAVTVERRHRSSDWGHAHVDDYVWRPR